MFERHLGSRLVCRTKPPGHTALQQYDAEFFPGNMPKSSLFRDVFNVKKLNTSLKEKNQEENYLGSSLDN